MTFKDVVVCKTCKRVTHTSFITNDKCAAALDEYGWHTGCGFGSLTEDDKDSVREIIQKET